MVPSRVKSMILRPLRPIAGSAAPILASSLILGGCMSAGIDTALTVDRSVVTGSIDRQAPIPGSDDAALIEAVADVDLERTPKGPFAWANPLTGTTGVIAFVEEDKGEDGTCRRFSTSRRDALGKRSFTGLGCRDADSPWHIVTLSPGS